MNPAFQASPRFLHLSGATFTQASRSRTMRRVLAILLLSICSPLFAQKAAIPPPTKPPLEAVDITKLPEGTAQLDLYLLMGQSNMKGRGVMPEEPKRDPRIVMMHIRDDQWYLARHPLHLTGDA
jgi:hypothetical protein